MRDPVAECERLVWATQAHSAGLSPLEGLFADAGKVHPAAPGAGRISSVH